MYCAFTRPAVSASKTAFHEASPALHLILSTGLAEAGSTFGNGSAECGPHAVLQAFQPLCAALAASSGGKAVLASSPADVDRACRRLGGPDRCVHLCFALPDQVPANLACPTIPVFGWGMGSLPSEPAVPARPGSAARTGPPLDWPARLARFGRVVCLSQSAADAVRAAMGDGFPVCVAAPPASVGASRAGPPGRFRLQVTGSVADTARWTQSRPPVVHFETGDDLADAAAATPAEEVLYRTPAPWRKTLRYRLGTTRLHARQWYREAVADLLPAPVVRAVSATSRGMTRAAQLALARGGRKPAATDGSGQEPAAWEGGEVGLELGGVVFTAVHGMWDRSWSDAISAFVWTFRDEADATLLIRSPRIDENTREALAGYLKRLLPFACRVVLVDAGLSPVEAAALHAGAAYYVCASHAEAAPLSMMGFMAAGAPAVTPSHSALAELASGECAVLVGSSRAHDYWPGDAWERLYTSSHRLDWDSLCAAYAQAFRVAADPPAYAAMSAGAAGRVRRLAAEGERALAEFLGLAPAALPPPATARTGHALAGASAA